MKPGPLESRLNRNGWSVAFLPSEGPEAPAGFWAYKGGLFEPDLETGLFDTAEAAAQVALDTWPAEFALQ